MKSIPCSASLRDRTLQPESFYCMPRITPLVLVRQGSHPFSLTHSLENVVQRISSKYRLQTGLGESEAAAASLPSLRAHGVAQAHEPRVTAEHWAEGQGFLCESVAWRSGHLGESGGREGGAGCRPLCGN